MKILRIEAKKAFFIRPSDWKPGASEHEQCYKTITSIDKDDLVSIVDYLISGDAGMDVYKEDLIANPAEQIVYQFVYEGLSKVKRDRERIKSEVDAVFEAAKKKYN